ncbi:MAG TPA: HNH endonuclease [Verrucomicrobiota bacterium]|jgi:Mor family transcriptional regulator|nr:MAG: hypothetical protein BWX80_03178 [Candidatus Hydrogenedentes bacterium ADurb.Bin101]HPY31122.1 HNH endonuclease [Verrucomicrobiota bacterium]HQB17561.1 HNH endonuclease [Verrucomicrobiota bacterium]
MNYRPYEVRVCSDGKRRGCFLKLTHEERKQRFWDKIKVGDPDECWLWLGAKQPSRGLFYGVYEWKGKGRSTHRIAYMLAKGPIPKGLVVRHLCHNSLCCNPRHLEVGTQAQNVEDAVKAGRMASGERSGRRKHPEAFPCGEDCKVSKLTEKQVLEIHRAYRSEELHSGQLAERYQIAQVHVNKILKFETWAHLRPTVESWGLPLEGLHRKNLGKARLLFGKNEQAVRREMRILREKGLTFREIAKKYQCSESAVRTRLKD